MREINIAVSASSTYIRYARVMMASIYKTHPHFIVNLYVFYLNDDVAMYRKVLEEQSSFHNRLNQVHFVKVEKNLLNKVDDGKGWALDLWCRWYSLNFLVNKCERVLLLGVDTFVREDISEFYFQDMSGYYFACAPDMFVSNTNPEIWPAIKRDMNRHGLTDKKRYINGDVVLLNLDATQHNLSFDDFLCLYKKNKFTCWDQDVITYCFKDYLKYQNEHLFNYFPNLNLPNLDDSYNVGHAKILHFAGGPKPWNVAPWRAQQYYGIPEWWELAKKEGLPRVREYLRYFKKELRDLM